MMSEIDLPAGYGDVAYRAYRDAAGGKSLVTGKPIPEWAGLPAEIQQAWHAAALAVAEYTMRIPR